jgi:gas vesicle protein
MFQFKSKRNALRNWVAIAISLCLSQFAVCQEPTEDVPSARPPQLPSEFSENLKDVLQDVQEIVKDAQDAIEGSGKEEVVGAEIDASMSLESISESPTKPADATDAAVSDLESQDPSSIKILNENTPDWVKEGLVLGEDHRLAVSSSLFPDREQCIGDLKSRLMNEVRSYLDKHVLELTSASQLPELTEEYVEANWLVADREFDNVQDRPSGTYHQLWK